MEEEDFPNFSLEFNFFSIQETAEKPNEQQQQARRFPYSISWKPLRFASWFPTLISCSPNLPRVYIRLCKHGNHFTFLHYYLFNYLVRKLVRYIFKL